MFKCQVLVQLFMRYLVLKKKLCLSVTNYNQFSQIIFSFLFPFKVILNNISKNYTGPSPSGKAVGFGPTTVGSNPPGPAKQILKFLIIILSN